MKKKKSTDSVFDEPQMRPSGFAADPGEKRLKVRAEVPSAYDSVWNEPDHLNQGPNRPYAEWMEAGRSRTPASVTWLVTFGVALVAGPIAIVTAFWGSGQTIISILALTVVGPLVEEMGKVLGALMVVDRFPYLFRYRFQILFCCVFSGVVFACIENLIYLNVYIPEPSASLVHWRWTVCVALHSGCSLIAGLGVVRVWSESWQTLSPPKAETGANLWLVAIIVHGAYNAFAIALESFATPF